MLVSLDDRGQVQDLYFPYVGQENHIGRDNVHRVGVFVDGVMAWLDDPAWDIEMLSHDEALLGKVKARHDKLQVTLTFTDVVYNEKNVFIRNISVSNEADREREIKLYFGQEFELAESTQADTAYFDPRSRTIIHYKGQRVVLVNAFTSEGQFTEYTVGEFKTHGKAGSYKDAEDGHLERNTIEHGSVDSVVCLSFKLAPGVEKNGYYWLCVGEFIPEVHTLNQYVLEKNPAYLTNTTRDYWTAWVNRYNFSFYGLSDEVISLFKKSLLFMRAAVDEGGSVIASADASMLQGGKDTYGYMWPRDGAYIAMALDKSGDSQASRKFFEFSDDVLSAEGYLMHKFRPDRSLGSSWHPWIRNDKIAFPIQEDETALTLIALLKHYEHTRDLEFIEKLYVPFIEKMADFMCQYRDEGTGLPLPSYDLWEEKYGVHTYTAATVYGALRSAAVFAEILGKTSTRDRYEKVASEIKQAIETHLYDESIGAFVKMVELGDSGVERKDKAIDISSLFGIVQFGVLPLDDERVKSTFAKTEEALSLQTEVGGIARYQDDAYYRIDQNTPGNSWILTTLWLAQCKIARAKNEADLDSVKEVLAWCVDHALPTGVLPEQLHPHTGEPLSATPLTWSHAEYVLTVIKYLDKLEEFGVCKACNPIR